MDNIKWNLDTLYTGFDSADFRKDLKSLTADIEHLNIWAETHLSNTDDALEKLEYYINFQNTFGDTASKLMEYSQLVLSADCNNEKALKNCNILEELISETTAAEVTFMEWLNKIQNLNELIQKSEILKTHEFFLNEVLKEKKHSLSKSEEVIISKLKTTGSSAWGKLQDTLISTLNADVEIDGKSETYPLPAVRNMAYSNDSNTRKAAYIAEINALKSISASSAACLNSIKGEVISIAKMKKYTSPLAMTLEQARMDSETLDALISVLKANVNVFEKYFIKKAEILGHKNGLPFYDLFAPIGTVNMKFTYKEAQKIIIENFSTFSNDLGEYARKAFQNNWIDLSPREGKCGGAFCSNLHSIGESRILTNFTGSFNDVITLAHELGHGYHGAMLDSQTYLNCDYPMPIAETASTFCETIVKNALLKTSSKEESAVILENDISDNAQIIVDILSRFIFEDNVFKERVNGSLSVNELCDIMLDAQRKTYGDGLNGDYMHKYMWVCKPHYYDGDYNYYNFPYAFGLLFAKGLYGIYIKKGPAFCNDYNNLLAYTGKSDLYSVAKLADIDLHSHAFWQSSIDIITKDIEKFVEMQ